MAFTITGVFLGEDTTVSVLDDGTLQCDEATRQALIDAASYYDGRAVGPTNGPCTVRDHLSSPISAWYLLPRVFAEGATVSGEPPEIPAWPPGEDDLNLDDWVPPQEAEPRAGGVPC
jgi:hypothetical protein